MSRFRLPARAGCALVLTAIAQAVMAQTAPASPAAAASAPTASASSGTSLDRVTITANKREERLQEVPAAASVVQSQQLDQQNIEGVGDLTRSVATLSGSGSAVTIRGFGAGSTTATSEGSLGILVDGVSLSGAAEFPPNFFDVERVEVLEGPQGTLFGKNSTAGIINIVSKAPSTASLNGAVRADVKSRDGRTLQGMVNAPLGEHVALRVAGSVLRDPSMLHDLRQDVREEVQRKNARARLKWDVTPDVTVNLIADKSINESEGPFAFAVFSATPGSLLSTQLAACGVVVGPENTDTCGGSIAKSRTDIGGLSGQIDWNIGDYTLTSVTARRTAETNGGLTDIDSIPAAAPNFGQAQFKSYKNLSQEIRVASPDASWGNFVAGIYYFDGDLEQKIEQRYTIVHPVLGSALLGQASHTLGNVKSAALFGQGTYKINKQLSLNLGARWGDDKVTAGRTLAMVSGALAPFAPLTPVAGEKSATYTSWRLGSQYEFSRAHIGYVSFVKGYKGPAVNENAIDTSIPLIVRAEIPKVMEVGLKNVFLDGRFALNVAAYRSRITDFQATVFNPASAQFVFSNAPEARTHGLSVSFYGRPSREVTINGGAAYMVAKYGPGYFTACAAGAPAGCLRNAENDQVGGTPKFRANLSAEYAVPLGSFKAAFAGDVVYQTSQVFNPEDPIRNLGARTTVGARMSFRPLDDKWGVALYVRNLLDEFQPAYRTANILGFVAGDARSHFQQVGPESRRLFGLTVDAKF